MPLGPETITFYMVVNTIYIYDILLYLFDLLLCTITSLKGSETNNARVLMLFFSYFPMSLHMSRNVSSILGTNDVLRSFNHVFKILHKL